MAASVGSTDRRAYTVPVIATTHAEAIKQARADRGDQEGRFAVPADYRARLRKP